MPDKRPSARSKKPIEVAFWLLGVLGAALFILAFVVHIHVLALLGIGFMVLAALVSVGVYASDSTPETKLIGRASQVWAVLFAVWLIVAAASATARSLAAIVGGIFVIGAFALAYLWWRAGRMRR